MSTPLAWIGSAGGMPWPVPFGWGLLLGVVGMWLRLSSTSRSARNLGSGLGAVSLVLLAWSMPSLSGWTEQLVFWFLGGVAVVGAAIAISVRSPIYMGIWFAISLLGTAGLFLFLGAQFVGVATIVVYAGAIVVAFLFVLMLAEPHGYAPYDRVSWAWFSVPLSLLAGAALIAVLLADFWHGSEPAVAPGRARPAAVVQEEHHMAYLGSELFARHLISVEVAGTLLLIALVGAVVIVLHGKTPETAESSDMQAERGESEPGPPPDRLPTRMEA